MKPGDTVIWKQKPNGGYGFIVPVDATILRIGEKTATIEVRRTNGATVKRVVRIESLREKRHAD